MAARAYWKGSLKLSLVSCPVLLYPGDGVTLHETVKLPKALVDYCHIANVAGISFPFGFHDDDPSDDYDVGVASIAAPGCVPPAVRLPTAPTTTPTICSR